MIAWHRPNPPVGALGDKVRPSTSYVTVACTSAKRWFDLDAERGESTGQTRGYVGDKRALNLDGGRLGPYTEEMAAAGAPPLDTWIIPTQPYSGAHYATFPVALPRKLINLMCPRQVCTVCGEPRRRVVGEAEYVPSATNRGGVMVADAARVAEGVNGWVGADGSGKASVIRSALTLGWTDCGCPCDCYPPHADEANNASRTNCKRWRRGVVLDPFAGSGTTLVAASELGRDSIGIDLDERNLDLARQRCGLFLEVDA